MNDGTEGEATGGDFVFSALDDSRQKLGNVRFVALRGHFAGARTPAVEKGLELGEVDGFSGGQTVEGHPNGLPMGLAENGDFEAGAEVR